MFNCGVKEVQTRLKENGNPSAVFNVDNLTVFEVSVYRNTSSPIDKSKSTGRGTRQNIDYSVSQGVPSQGVPSQGVPSQGVPSRDVGMEIVLNGILSYCSEPKTLKEISEYLGIKAFKRVKTRYINRLLSAHKLVMTVPDRPTSRFQKYVATTKSDTD